jgi:hypothetical protein
VGGLAKLFAGIGYCYAQAGDSDGRKVRQIIADLTHLIGREAKLGQYLLQCGMFVFDALPDNIDAEFGNAELHDLRAAKCNQSKAVACLLPEANAHAIADVECFGFDALVVDNNPTVGQHPIDVGKHQSYRLAAVGKRHEIGFSN